MAKKVDLFPGLEITDPVKPFHRYTIHSQGGGEITVKVLSIKGSMAQLRWPSGSETWVRMSMMEPKIVADQGYCCDRLVTRDNKPCMACLERSPAVVEQMLNIDWKNPVEAKMGMEERISQTLLHGGEAVSHLLLICGRPSVVQRPGVNTYA